jgi:hypothetical protein
MAVNVITNLYEGGTRPDSSRYAMLPSTNTGSYPITGYADHQRRRSYQVTRQMNFSPLVPYGGLGNSALTDQKDWCWYADLVAGGSNIAVDDVWNMIVIPPYTRLEYIEAWIFTAPPTGTTFTVDVHNAAGVAVVTATLTSANLVTAMPGPLQSVLVAANEQNDDEVRYLGIHITAAGSQTGVGKLQGLNFAVAAEVVDWGSFDLNGNA